MKRRHFRTGSLFCGAGGEHAGLEEALHRLGVDRMYHTSLAVNHWQLVIDVFRNNFPGVSAFVEDLTIPSTAALPFAKSACGKTEGFELLWASPSCVHFSNARAGVPKSDQQRSHADEVVDLWLKKLNVNVFLMENVKEFRDYGPLLTKDERIGKRLYKAGQPDPRRKGEFFKRFIKSLEAIGYTVDYKILNAADYGDATSRHRFFLQAVKTGGIRWPEKNHVQPGSRDDDGTKPHWRTAAEIINWSIPGKSIFYRKTPLVKNSKRRIRHGLKKQGFAKIFETGTVEPYLTVYHGGIDGDRRTKGLQEPLPTVDTSNRYTLVQPFISKTFGGCNTSPTSAIGKPTPTVTTVDHNQLVTPFVVKYQGTSNSEPVTDPLSTVTAQGKKHGLIQPFITQFYGTSNSSNIDAPLPTVTTRDRFMLIETILTHGDSVEELEVVRCLDDIDNLSLDKPFLLEVGGDRYLVDIHTRMLTPGELAAAMGFPSWYRFIDRDGSDLTKENKIKMIGNACPVHTVASLIEAIILERPEEFNLGEKYA